MKITLFAVVTLATIAWVSSADPECVFRKKSGLDLRWPNPENCGRFYRCSRGIKREIICPNDREYDNVSGKCVPAGTGTCKRSSVSLFAGTVAATENNLCQNAESGSYLPRPGYCRDFYICNANVAYLQNCDSGSYFSASKGVCVPDTTTSCWQNDCINQVDGYTYSDEADCTKFYICSNKEVVQESCELGYYFDAVTKICTLDVNNDKCWLNSCVNKTDGQLVPDNCNEHGYLECSANQPIKKSCGEDIFDAKTLTCVSKSTNETVPETTTESAPCTAETTTSSGTEVTTPCNNEGTTPRSVETSTSTGTEVTTPCNNEGTTPRSVETTTKANVELITPCNSEDTTPRSVETTTSPNVALITPCNSEGTTTTSTGTEVTTPSNNEGTTPRSIETTSSSGTEVTTPCNNEGTTPRSIETTSSSGTEFTTPCNNEGTTPRSVETTSSSGAEVTTPSNNEGKTPRSVETTSSSGAEVTTPCNSEVTTPRSVETTTKPNVELITPCNSEDTTPRSVETTTKPNVELITPCNSETTTPCNSETTTQSCNNDCPGGYKTGDFVADPKNCMKFLICSEGKLYDYSCGAGNYFNAEQKICELDTTGKCPQCTASVSRKKRSVTEEGCGCPGGFKTGDFVPHEDCSKFYICDNGTLTEQSCEYGNLFDSCNKVCIPDTNNTCWAKSPCAGQKNNTIVADPKNCNKYFKCQNEEEISFTCNVGDYFNVTLGYCVPDTELICSNPCQNTTGIVFLPYPLNCSKFYFCNAGKSFIQKCTTGFFDNKKGLCLDNALCSTNICEGKPDGTAFPIENSTKNFTVCLNNVPTNRTCPSDRIFDAKREVCLETPSANCDQSSCPSIAPNQGFATINNSPNNFCVCKNDQAYEYQCPTDYIFNAKVGVCYSNAPCDPEFCLNAPEYQVAVNRRDIHSFCLCVSNVSVPVSCPNNGIFNPNLGTDGRCVPNIIADPECEVMTCLNSPENTTYPANTTEGFCVCTKNASEFRYCPDNYLFNATLGICMPECEVEKCANNTPGYTFADTASNTSYCYCYNSTYVTKLDCPKNTFYDAEREICLKELCDSSVCQNQTVANLPFPANDNPAAFCLCDGNQAKFYPCIEGSVFNGQVCIPETYLKCNISLCADATPQTPYPTPAINNTAAFCYCFAPDTVRLFDCPVGTLYDSVKKICIAPESTNSCTCPGGYKEGQFLPNPTDCRKYYICSSGHLQGGDCGAGNYFDDSSMVCKPDIKNVCQDDKKNSSSCTCVGGYTEGQMLPNPNSCQLFYICSNGILQEMDCGSNNKFDANQGACVPKYNKRTSRTLALANADNNNDDVRIFNGLNNLLKNLNIF